MRQSSVDEEVSTVRNFVQICFEGKKGDKLSAPSFSNENSEVKNYYELCTISYERFW